MKRLGIVLAVLCGVFTATAQDGFIEYRYFDIISVYVPQRGRRYPLKRCSRGWRAASLDEFSQPER
jgi:hypothetical protein